jgi:hypothetical protein
MRRESVGQDRLGHRLQAAAAGTLNDSGKQQKGKIGRDAAEQRTDREKQAYGESRLLKLLS